VVVVSTFGALNGIVLTGPRVYHAMARDGLLFGWLGDLHPTFRTPHRAIFLQAAWASVLVATGTYETLFVQVVYTEWIFFALLAAGLLVLRRSGGFAPRFSLGGGPLLPALFVVAALLVAAYQIRSASAQSLIGLGLVALGVPVYYLTTARARA
jgi:APA family basic amino acid/polyamine antiporter